MSHPIVTSFIWMKWRKMRHYFYCNVIFYVLFFSFLTAWVLTQTQFEDDGPTDPPTKEKILALQWITFVILYVSINVPSLLPCNHIVHKET